MSLHHTIRASIDAFGVLALLGAAANQLSPLVTVIAGIAATAWYLYQFKITYEARNRHKDDTKE